MKHRPTHLALVEAHRTGQVLSRVSRSVQVRRRVSRVGKREKSPRSNEPGSRSHVLALPGRQAPRTPGACPAVVAPGPRVPVLPLLPDEPGYAETNDDKPAGDLAAVEEPLVAALDGGGAGRGRGRGLARAERRVSGDGGRRRVLAALRRQDGVFGREPRLWPVDNALRRLLGTRPASAGYKSTNQATQSQTQGFLPKSESPKNLVHFIIFHRPNITNVTSNNTNVTLNMNVRTSAVNHQDCFELNFPSKLDPGA
jgi:hypothetical protein